MELITSRLKFLAIVLIGMTSLLFIYDKIGYNYKVYHNINKTIQNPFLMNDNPISVQNFDFLSKREPFESQSNFSKSVSNREYSVNKSVNRSVDYLEYEYKKLLKKVLKFESKHLIPIKKRSHDSKLLYPIQIKSITVMTIGDKECDKNFGSALKVVIIVISRVNGFNRRQVIRQTWAQRISQSKDVKLYFAIGLSTDSELQKKIDSENKEFNDLLQWNFIDNYYNLTIKSLGILRWFSLYCFKADFLYKIDDDCILNYQNLLQFASKATNNTIYGHLWKKAFVDRQSNSKFFISKSDFSYNSYPDYTGGPWLMSGAVVPVLYETAITQSLPALPYEDVYITGVVASKANVKRKQLTGLIYFSKTMVKKLNYCWFEKSIIFWQNLDDLLIKTIWNNIQNSRDLVCLQSNDTTIYPKIT